MRSILALLFILMLSPAVAFENGAQLLDGCQRFEHGMKILPDKSVEPPRDAKAIICWGHILAMQELSAYVESDAQHPMTGACPAQNSTAVQLLRVVIKFARANVEVLGKLRATTVILLALRETYPCGEKA